MEKKDLDAVIDRVLREAAKAGDLDAKKAWRVKNGYPPTPAPARRPNL